MPRPLLLQHRYHADLHIDVHRVRNAMRKRLMQRARMPSIIVTSVLEYCAKEVLNLAASAARVRERKRVDTADIATAIRYDDSLNELLSNVQVAGTPSTRRQHRDDVQPRQVRRLARKTKRARADKGDAAATTRRIKKKKATAAKDTPTPADASEPEAASEQRQPAAASPARSPAGAAPAPSL